MSISTNIDLLITKMLMLSRLDVFFPIKMADMLILHCGAAGRVQKEKQVQAGQGPVRGAAGMFAGRRPRLL